MQPQIAQCIWRIVPVGDGLCARQALVVFIERYLYGIVHFLLPVLVAWLPARGAIDIGSGQHFIELPEFVLEITFRLLYALGQHYTMQSCNTYTGNQYDFSYYDASPNRLEQPEFRPRIITRFAILVIKPLQCQFNFYLYPDVTMDLILYAIPVFFLLILLEFGYGVLRGRNTYRLNDTINSLSLGSLSRLQGLVILGVSGTVYEVIVERFQLAQLSASAPWVWIACFILYDLVYYWKHRWGHEVALFWGAHVAHHQSEDFNLGTALRQTSMDFYSVLFYLPFFALGFPAEVLFSVVSLNLIYQFWVHTEHVPKLGVLEWLLVTPSNHRVHHARNSMYVDRNYGGVFIVWDRLFGSFQEELADEVVVFGLRKPLRSWNPVWANVHVYWRLLQDCIRAEGILNKLKIWFMPPAWNAPGVKTSCKLRAEEVDLSVKFDPLLPARVRLYTFAQFVFTVALSLTLLLNTTSYSYLFNVGAVLYLTYSFYVHGVWMEALASARWHESARLCTLLLVLQIMPPSTLLQLSLSAFCVVSLLCAWLFVFNKATPLPLPIH